MNSFWDVESTTLQCAVIDGIEITPGSRVRLCPRPGADILDLALAGKVAFVEAIEQDVDNHIHVAVTVEDDPGRDLGRGAGATGGWQPGHRFFFAVDEVEPLDGRQAADP